MHQAQAKAGGLEHWAQRALEECDKAQVDFAADPVHDLRVAIRRCRSMADGFLSIDPDPGWKEMKKMGKALFASLGDLRDTQVMMEWVAKLAPGDDPLAASLLQTLEARERELKQAAQQELQNFDRRHWLALNLRLARRAAAIPLENLVFQHLALERWHDAYDLHRRAMRNRSGVAYHQLRIGLKRFRYTAENFLPARHERWAKDLRQLQDALGEVHDFDVLWAMIKSHHEVTQEHLTAWHARILHERSQRLIYYRSRMLGTNSLWRQWRFELPQGIELEQAAMQKLQTWAAFLDPDFRETRGVTRLALRLYDVYARANIIAGNRQERRILEAAGVLHEIGRRKSTGGHRKRGFRMIRKISPPLGWSPEDMNAVALVARYHIGTLPRDERRWSEGMTVMQRKRLRPLAGMLRLADALKGTHTGEHFQIQMNVRNGAVVVGVAGLRQPSPAAEQLAVAKYLLEAACRVPVLIETRAPTGVHNVGVRKALPEAAKAARS